MYIYLIAALIVAVLCALVTIGAAADPSRKKLVRVRIEIANTIVDGEVRVITRLVPAAIADILFKKVSRGTNAEDISARPEVSSGMPRA